MNNQEIEDLKHHIRTDAALFHAFVDFMKYAPIVQDALDRAANLDNYNRASDMGVVANLFEEKCSAIRKILSNYYEWMKQEDTDG